MTKDYIKQYLEETVQIAQTVSQEEIEKGIAILRETKKNEGRLFILGVGGSAANASHAVNDFRKIGGIETYGAEISADSCHGVAHTYGPCGAKVVVLAESQPVVHRLCSGACCGKSAEYCDNSPFHCKLYFIVEARFR